MTMLRIGLVFITVLGVMCATSASPVSAQDESPAFWGPGTNFHFVSAEEFRPSDEYTEWVRYLAADFWGVTGLCGGNGHLSAAVRLPTGSLITGMTLIYYDSSVTYDFQARLMLHWVTAPASSGSTEISPLYQSSGDPGYAAEWVDIDPDHTVQYIDGATAQSYVLELAMPRYGRGNIFFRGVIVGWKRQVSPAPGSATFDDVPTGHWAFRYIEALSASGITAGCSANPPLYCPDDPVTRAEMAVFLAAALGLHFGP